MGESVFEAVAEQRFGLAFDGAEVTGTVEVVDVRQVDVAGLADLVETDHEVTGEVRLVPTHGHSPGHVSVLIESGGERALITGDATHHPVQWAEPDWGMAADSDSAGAAETRRRLRAEHGAAGTLILGTHYAAPSAGRLVADGEAWRFVAEPG